VKVLGGNAFDAEFGYTMKFPDSIATKKWTACYNKHYYAAEFESTRKAVMYEG
jgi:hypothetical protein